MKTPKSRERETQRRQICGIIPHATHVQFKSRVALEGRTISAVLEELITGYLKGSRA